MPTRMSQPTLTAAQSREARRTLAADASSGAGARWWRVGAGVVGLLYLVMLGAMWLLFARHPQLAVFCARAQQTQHWCTLQHVDSGGAAGRAGLRPGDVVLTISGLPASVPNWT